MDIHWTKFVLTSYFVKWIAVRNGEDKFGMNIK